MSEATQGNLTPILMLAPYFAPQTHAAMFRAHKFARYLPEHGFKPIIVAPDINYLYNCDASLLDELPPDVEIHRARYIEPSLRGIRMALGGNDRTFAAMKAAGALPSAPAPSGGAATNQRGPSIGGLISRAIGDYPDRYWTWSGPAYRLASKLVQEKKIRLLYTTANPESYLRAAIRLKQTHGMTWLFDSRDPLGYGQKHVPNAPISLLMQRSILSRSIRMADHVTGLARSYGQIFFDLYGLDESRYSFIPTGLDEAYLSQDTPPRENFLLHIGEVMPNAGRHAYQTLEQIFATAQGKEPFDRLLFVGRKEVNTSRVAHLLKDMPRLRERVEFLDHMPQAQVYGLVRRAKACLLVPGESRYWWTNFAKMVDYIALGAPVIAHVPAISEARQELTEAGTGFFLNGQVAEDAAALAEWLETATGITPTPYCKRYTAQRQAADLAAILRRLSGMSAQHGAATLKQTVAKAD